MLLRADDAVDYVRFHLSSTDQSSFGCDLPMSYLYLARDSLYAVRSGKYKDGVRNGGAQHHMHQRHKNATRMK